MIYHIVLRNRYIERLFMLADFNSTNIQLKKSLMTLKLKTREQNTVRNYPIIQDFASPYCQ